MMSQGSRQELRDDELMPQAGAPRTVRPQELKPVVPSISGSPPIDWRSGKVTVSAVLEKWVRRILAAILRMTFEGLRRGRRANRPSNLTPLL